MCAFQVFIYIMVLTIRGQSHWMVRFQKLEERVEQSEKQERIVQSGGGINKKIFRGGEFLSPFVWQEVEPFIYSIPK